MVQGSSWTLSFFGYIVGSWFGVFHTTYANGCCSGILYCYVRRLFCWDSGTLLKRAPTVSSLASLRLRASRSLYYSISIPFPCVHVVASWFEMGVTLIKIYRRITGGWRMWRNIIRRKLHMWFQVFQIWLQVIQMRVSVFYYYFISCYAVHSVVHELWQMVYHNSNGGVVHVMGKEDFQRVMTSLDEHSKFYAHHILSRKKGHGLRRR